jgi:RNA 2',3'-cyclic 3'-phosphodiesterase
MFVALDLPAAVRARLAAWRDILVGDRSDLRPVRVEALHVTLVFLGWQDESAAEAIAAAAFDAAPAAVPTLSAGDVRPLPPRDPRLFALDLDDSGGAATALQAAVSGALERGGWYTPEKRPFWPHVTLARVKRGVRRAPPLASDPPVSEEPFEARDLTLYRSTLRPQGALYEPLARREL